MKRPEAPSRGLDRAVQDGQAGAKPQLPSPSLAACSRRGWLLKSAYKTSENVRPSPRDCCTLSASPLVSNRQYSRIGDQEKECREI